MHTLVFGFLVERLTFALELLSLSEYRTENAMNISQTTALVARVNATVADGDSGVAHFLSRHFHRLESWCRIGNVDCCVGGNRAEEALPSGGSEIITTRVLANQPGLHLRSLSQHQPRYVLNHRRSSLMMRYHLWCGILRRDIGWACRSRQDMVHRFAWSRASQARTNANGG